MPESDSHKLASELASYRLEKARGELEDARAQIEGAAQLLEAINAFISKAD